MMNTPARSLQQLRQGLHVSYSQISTYLTCPLRYLFHYFQGRSPEHVGASLLLGSAVHSSLAHYYENLRDKGAAPSGDDVLDHFRETLKQQLGQVQTPILYKAEAPDAETLLAQGEGLLRAFLADPSFQGMEVIAVELPLQATLTSADGAGHEIALIGAVDLLLRDQLGRLLAVDHKTAKQALTQEAIDRDLQFSAYALLLAENGYLEEGQSLHCAFNVLRKLKAPKVERHITLRTETDRRRFARIADSVLAAIEAQAFVPCTGWQCADCPYQKACADW